mgnify:FL=1
MNVSLKSVLPVSMAVAGAVALTSCEHNMEFNKFTHDYCINNNKTENDYHDVVYAKGLAESVSKLDSMVYRDMFETTKLAKDSAKVAEFNEIAKAYRAPSNYSEDVLTSQINKARKAGMLHKDYVEMTSYTTTRQRQNFLDNFAYKKFFKENGVLNRNLEKKCDEYSKKLIDTID